MMKCREVTKLVAADMVEELGLGRRLEMRLHMFMCRHCRRYLQQIRTLGRGARELAERDAPSPDRLQEIEQEILDQLHDD